MFNALPACIEVRISITTVQKIAEEVISYSNQYFEEEEALMEQCAFTLLKVIKRCTPASDAGSMNYMKIE